MKIDMDTVPSTIAEATTMLVSALEEDEKNVFLSIKESEIVIFHLTLGSEIRNDWSLTEKDTPLVNNFKLLGITHPDDMSGIILTSVHRVLNKKPIKLKDQIVKYQEYWQKEIGKPYP